MVVSFSKLLKTLSNSALAGTILISTAMASEPEQHITLIHSAWSGDWQWSHVTPELKARGYKVLSDDLPGHGTDNTPPESIHLDTYVQSIIANLDQLKKPTILVGHSFGGIVASQVAELRPGKVSAIVYLCAFMLPSGTSFSDATKDMTTSEVLDNLEFSATGYDVTIASESVHNAVAHDVPLNQFKKIESNLTAEPTQPLKEALDLSDKNYGQIPRYFIECAQDKAIPLASQKSMHKAQGVEHVYSLNSSHMPVFSMPDQVVTVLDDIANREKARRLALRTRNKWTDAINAGDADEAASVYAKNAIVTAGPFGNLNGKKALRKFWAGMIAQGAKDAELFDTSVMIVDSETVSITSGWKMNLGGGRITTEIWKIRPDNTAVLHRGIFTMQNK